MPAGRRLVTLAALLLASLAVAGENAGRPNILFVFSDDHARTAVGAYGGPFAELDPTPHIDRLAREGALFERAYCTNSLCGPSRAVVLTGKHSHVNGFRQNGDRFDATQPTFPRALQRAGYATAIVGKWHLGTDPEGFDYWRVLPDQGEYYNPRFLCADGESRVEGYCTDVVTGMAEEWLREGRDPGKPFLLMCQHKAPHRTWMPGPEELGLWADREMPVPVTLFDEWRDNASPARDQQMTVADDLDLVHDLFVDTVEPGIGRASRDASGTRNLAGMTAAQRRAWDAAFGAENRAFAASPPKGEALVRWKLQRYLRNYLRCVRGVDRSVGRLLALLDELGLAESTIVVYSSDQGFFLGEHGWYDKRWMYDESLSMPLVVRWPGVAAPGTRVRRMVQNLDLAPTFLEAAGVPVPGDVQGRSLAPLLRGEAPADWRTSVYYHYFEGPPAVHRVAAHYGVRTDTHKLIHFYDTDEWELYDLAADPDERDNVYGRSENAAVVRELEELLRRERASVGDSEGAPRERG